MLFVLRSLRSPDAAKWPPILRKPLPTNLARRRPNPPNLTRRQSSGEAAVEAVEAEAGVIDAPTLTLARSRGREREGARHRGRKVGKAITSRIEGLSVNSITKRSMPMPSPPQGGSPYSRAVT